MKRDDEDELLWAQPDLCQKCVWLCPWNGSGYGCSHPSQRKLLQGGVVCGGEHFKATRPWHLPRDPE